MGNKIQLFGELESVAVDKKLVDAVQVKDSAWVDPTTKEVSEETQSAINAALKQMAEDAAKSASDLKLGYDPVEKQLKLYIGDGNSENPISSISSSDFTKDGMIETVLGPVTPVWNDVTDQAAANTPRETAKWAVAEDTGEQAFFALDVPTGYLLIQEITLGNTYLGFIWNTNTDADKTEGKVYDSKNFKASALDVSTLFNPIQAGPGLETNAEGVTKVKIKDTTDHTEKYLHIDKDGLFSTGIDKAIEDAVKGISENVDTLTTTVTKLDTEIESLKSTWGTLQTDLPQVKEEVRRLKTSVAFRETAFETTSGIITPSEDAIIRNIHCYYGAEEIEVLITRAGSDGNYKGKSVTLSCNAHGLELSRTNPLIVTYEEVYYDQNNVSSSTTTNNE